MRVPYRVGLAYCLSIPDSMSLSFASFYRVVAIGMLFAAGDLGAAEPGGKPRQRSARSLIGKQEPPNVSPRVLEQMTPETSSILISLSKQRAYLMHAGEIGLDSPISSGKRSRVTPTGKFTVIEKDKDHRSNLYGSFVDKRGRVVRAGVSTRTDAAPSGTRFSGSPMLYFLRLTHDGLGLHVGILPGYPASHGCIRLPLQAAKIFYEKTKIGTPAEIVD